MTQTEGEGNFRFVCFLEEKESFVPKPKKNWNLNETRKHTHIHLGKTRRERKEDTNEDDDDDGEIGGRKKGFESNRKAMKAPSLENNEQKTRHTNTQARVSEKSQMNVRAWK